MDAGVVPLPDRLLLGHGRDLLRGVLESTLRSRAEFLEKRGAARACSCGATGQHKGKATKAVMTALGAVVLGRAYFSCRACRLGGYLVDRLLGPDGFLTRQATRLVCLLGGRHSLADAERLLAECRGWKLSDETIRRACQAEAAPMAASRADSPTVAAAFTAAAGDVEFRVDAAKVNATGGWRGMKVGVFARRERGEPATPAEWDERELPAPTTRAATAAIETTDDFAPRWGEWADRLGIADRGAITVLGDGPNGSGRRRRGRTVLPDVQRSLEPVLGVSQLTT